MSEKIEQQLKELKNRIKRLENSLRDTDEWVYEIHKTIKHNDVEDTSPNGQVFAFFLPEEAVDAITRAAEIKEVTIDDFIITASSEVAELILEADEEKLFDDAEAEYQLNLLGGGEERVTPITDPPLKQLAQWLEFQSNNAWTARRNAEANTFDAVLEKLVSLTLNQ
jgi:hypothetical protein